MVKQSILLINPYHLSCTKNQLFLESKENNSITHIPIEDIGMLVLDNPQLTMSATLLAKLIEYNCTIVHCNDKHMPLGMSLALAHNHIHNVTVHKQIAMGLVRKKQLWKDIVIQKISNQAKVLKKLGKPYQELECISKRVKSDDTSNMEALAAKQYWSILFDNISHFARKRYGAYPNNFLNYGYAVLRGACARALIGSGLSLVIGIHHHNKYNAYCLVDDMIEPYRPFIDIAIWNIIKEHPKETTLTSSIKMTLIQSLYQDVYIHNKRHPLINGLTFTSASLVDCLDDTSSKVKLPRFYGV